MTPTYPPANITSEVIIKGIAHVLKSVAGVPLEKFLVGTAGASRDPPPPGPASSRYMLKLCGDEESVQFRALNFVVGVLQCRAMAEPESLHSTWNDYKRAVSAAGLQHVNIKATYICNYGHGPFLTGRGAVELASAAEARFPSSTLLPFFLGVP